MDNIKYIEMTENQNQQQSIIYKYVICISDCLKTNRIEAHNATGRRINPEYA
jgi:hypothetical protein